MRCYTEVDLSENACTASLRVVRIWPYGTTSTTVLPGVAICICRLSIHYCRYGPPMSSQRYRSLEYWVVSISVTAFNLIQYQNESVSFDLPTFALPLLAMSCNMGLAGFSSTETSLL